MKENLEYVSPELETVNISVSSALLGQSPEQGEYDDQCTSYCLFDDNNP